MTLADNTSTGLLVIKLLYSIYGLRYLRQNLFITSVRFIFTYILDMFVDFLNKRKACVMLSQLTAIIIRVREYIQNIGKTQFSKNQTPLFVRLRNHGDQKVYLKSLFLTEEVERCLTNNCGSKVDSFDGLQRW